MANGNGNGFWKNIGLLILIVSACFAAWFKIEATVKEKVADSESRIELRLDRVEKKVDAVLISRGIDPTAIE